MAGTDIWDANTWTPTFGTYGAVTRSTEPIWYATYTVPPNQIYFTNPQSCGVLTNIGPYPEPEDPNMKLPEGF
mgnify:CR=1 FL=1